MTLCKSTSARATRKTGAFMVKELSLVVSVDAYIRSIEIVKRMYLDTRPAS